MSNELKRFIKDYPGFAFGMIAIGLSAFVGLIGGKEAYPAAGIGISISIALSLLGLALPTSSK